MKKLMPKLKGFTIIEVIIVLVVGAVIMLAVFLVVPQLQQQSRNSQRQALLRRVLVAARQYTVTSGDLSSGNVTSQISNIIGQMPKDPITNTSYQVFVSTGDGSVDATIYLKYNVKCANNSVNPGVISDGSISAVIGLEPYGNTTVNGLPRKAGQKFCIND